MLIDKRRIELLHRPITIIPNIVNVIPCKVQKQTKNLHGMTHTQLEQCHNAVVQCSQQMHTLIVTVAHKILNESVVFSR